MKFRKVLITGSSGFIGRNLITYFESKKLEVIQLDVSNFKKKHGNVYRSIKDFTSFIHHNYLTPSDSVVLHFGANADARSSNIDSFNLLNIEYSRILFDSSLKAGIPVIFASSAAVYGSDFVEPNASSFSNLNPYASSKLQSEKDLILASERYGTQFSILRLFNVYGPNELSKGPMMSIPSRFCFDASHKREISIWSLPDENWKHGKQSRDFIYVDDLLKGIELLLGSLESFSGIFDLGSSLAMSFIELAEMIASLSQSRITFIDPPLNLSSIGYQKYTEAGIHRQNLCQSRTKIDLQINIEKILRTL
jgi:ADP-L-glycero-D-manno-heptose 6-epimerase